MSIFDICVFMSQGWPLAPLIRPLRLSSVSSFLCLCLYRSLYVYLISRPKASATVNKSFIFRFSDLSFLVLLKFLFIFLPFIFTFLNSLFVILFLFLSHCIFLSLYISLFHSILLFFLFFFSFYSSFLSILISFLFVFSFCFYWLSMLLSFYLPFLSILLYCLFIFSFWSDFISVLFFTLLRRRTEQANERTSEHRMIETKAKAPTKVMTS